jgi:hypothetical protein
MLQATQRGGRNEIDAINVTVGDRMSSSAQSWVALKTFPT